MADKKLQKSALRSLAEDLPIEVLNPLESAQYYSLVMPRPSELLRPFVDHYWIMRWDVPKSTSFVAEIIPSAYINLTFMDGGSRITGVTTGKYTYEVRGKGVIIGAKFLPGGYYGLTRQAASKLTDMSVPAQAIFSEATEEINTTALAARTDGEAVAMLEKVLLPHVSTPDQYLQLVQTIIRDIREEKYTTVASLVSAYDLSERRLQEAFQTYVGASPKWVMLRYRLIKATQLALEPSSDSWTQVAAELGYSDQSHFINDFKRIVGKTPKKYAEQSSKRS